MRSLVGAGTYQTRKNPQQKRLVQKSSAKYEKVEAYLFI